LQIDLAFKNYRPETAAGYRFTSVEIKEKAFRFDGIFIPDSVDKNIWFVEVQFQKRAEFYWEFIGEIFLYLSQYKPEHDWQAVAIFAKRSIEPEIPKQFRILFAGGHIERIYLDELPKSESLSLGLVRLIVAPKKETIALAHQLADPDILSFCSCDDNHGSFHVSLQGLQSSNYYDFHLYKY